ncbi:MAG: haloacid dehalogenase-like hydrolase, partial [Alphaproteobacteria bacterium]|nr:haloacid dehalogenase-like hydrolase [Alphaproteobacteria bacterium]
MLQKKDVVVFDFDGTLSASDSNREFFKYCFKHSIRPWLFLPCVIAGAVGARLNHGGLWWRQTIRNFITPKMVRDFAKDCIKIHKKNR